MSSIKDKLAAARPPERVVSLCLRGDLLARHGQLVDELAKARREAANSLGDGGAAEIIAQLEALRAEMVDGSIDLTLRAMSARRWDELMRESPPRADNAAEQRVGFAPTTFYQKAIRESCIEPSLDASDWVALIGNDDIDGCLTDGQWDELTDAVYALNRKPVSVPFLPSDWLKTTVSAPE